MKNYDFYTLNFLFFQEKIVVMRMMILIQKQNFDKKTKTES